MSITGHLIVLIVLVVLVYLMRRWLPIKTIRSQKPIYYCPDCLSRTDIHVCNEHGFVVVMCRTCGHNIYGIGEFIKEQDVIRMSE